MKKWIALALIALLSLCAGCTTTTPIDPAAVASNVVAIATNIIGQIQTNLPPNAVTNLPATNGAVVVTNAPFDPATYSMVPIGQGKMQVFYGRVNGWAGNPDLLTREIAYMAPRRVNYHIELAGWAKSGVWYDDAAFAKTASEYKRLVAMCRANKLWLMVSLINDNMASTKYGNVPVDLSKPEMWKRACELANIVKAEGPANVIVQPVAETQTAYGKKFEKEMATYLAEFDKLDNNPSRGTTKQSWAKWRAWHSESITQAIPRGQWGVSDTGAAIRRRRAARQLTVDGTLYAANDPAKVLTYRNTCEKSGAVAAAIYSWYDGFDAPAIDALAWDDAPAIPNHPVADGTILPSQVTWLGQNYSAAKQTVTLSDVSMSGTHLNFKSSAISWPPQGAKKCKAVGFLIRKIGDRYVGGKVEWCVVERGWYDIVTNTRKLTRLIRRSGYNSATLPASGETCWAGLGHPVNGSECSTLVPFVWK